MSRRCYSELITIPSFEERFRYLQCNGMVGSETFGSHRYLNQSFYTSPDWRRFRRQMILRDLGCDLGVEGFEIIGEPIIIHHIEPIAIEDILNKNLSVILNAENAICTRDSTHKAIHYGDDHILEKNTLVTRTPNDTCPWKR